MIRQKVVLIILCSLQFAYSMPKRKRDIFFPLSTPDSKSLKKTLGFVEDAYLNFSELITKYGYSSEEHIVTTEDGYQLTVFRILTKCPQAHIYPVILGHGICDSSDSWILTGPKTGLGYILSNKCYDVWAMNYRGNFYSRKHLCLNPDKDHMYWQFSFDENGNYDLPAVIDHILDATGKSKVYYIGHSQGGTNFLTMGSLKPEYNEKIQLSILIAPVVWMKNIEIPIIKVLSQHAKELKYALDSAGINELFGKSSLIHKLIELVCQYIPNEVCGSALAIATGYRPGSIDSREFAIVVGHVPAGASAKTFAHYAQFVTYGEFQRYDEGEIGNLQRYGVVTPPKYNISLITSPVLIISAESDLVATIKDTEILCSKLPNNVENYIVKEPTWSHNNHIWGINATELVFKKILYYLHRYDT